MSMCGVYWLVGMFVLKDPELLAVFWGVRSQAFWEFVSLVYSLRWFGVCVQDMSVCRSLSYFCIYIQVVKSEIFEESVSKV